MSGQLSPLLAMLATALLAVAVFAPKKREPPTSAPIATTSFVTERATPPHAALRLEPLAAPAPAAASWTAEIDPAAASLDAAGRIALVRALAALHEPWSDDLLARAAAGEADAAVRRAIDEARDPST